MARLPDPLDAEAVLPWEAEAECRTEPTDPGGPTLSVVMPIYNAGPFLERTIRSLICAGSDGAEVIVMDGGSTDRTPDILRHYEAFLTSWTSEPDRGQSDAINKGFARATGEILYWLNGDDILLPGVLPRVREYCAGHPETQVLSGNAYMTELDLSPIRHFKFGPEQLTYDYLLDYAAHHLVQPAVFFTRTAWEKAGPAKLELHYAMDAELFLNMAREFGIDHLDLDIAYSVYHEACKTRKDRGPSIIELAMVQARMGAFDQAGRTLSVLSDLLEDAERRVTEPPESAVHECPRCSVAEQRVRALEAEVSKNRELLLEMDLRETDV